MVLCSGEGTWCTCLTYNKDTKTLVRFTGWWGPKWGSLHDNILFSAKCHTKGKGDNGRCVELPKQRSYSRDDEEWMCTVHHMKLFLILYSHWRSQQVERCCEVQVYWVSPKFLNLILKVRWLGLWMLFYYEIGAICILLTFLAIK